MSTSAFYKANPAMRYAKCYILHFEIDERFFSSGFVARQTSVSAIITYFEHYLSLSKQR